MDASRATADGEQQRRPHIAPARMFSLRIPRRFLRGSYGRLVLTVTALACGVALICALDLVNRAVLRAFVEIVDTMAGRASLQVSVEDSGQFAEALADDVAMVPGVRQAVALVNATAFAADEPGESLTIHAIDLANSDAVRVYEPGDPEQVVPDPLVFLNQLDSIIVTKAFAARRHLQEESALVLDTASGRRTFTVRGIIDPRGVGQAFGGNLILMDLQAAEAVFTRPGLITGIDVVVDPGADVAAVAARIQHILPDGLRVETTAQRKTDLHAVMRSLQVLLEAVGYVALGAAFIIAFNRLTAVFEERTRQLGILRAIGVRRRAVWIELLKEAVLVGVASVAIGVPAGFALGRLILPVVASTTALNFRTVAPDAALTLNATSIVLAAAVGLAAAIAAAAVPAWRASGVDIAEILRGRGVELPLASQWVRWLSCAMLALCTAAAIAVQRATHDPTWGLIATLAMVVLTGALAQPLLRLMRSLLASSLLPWIGPTGRFVVGTLTRNLRRTSLAVAMVGVGLGTVVWLSLVAISFERTAVRVFEQAMRADFVVSSSHIGVGALEMPVDDTFAAQLEAVDGVHSIVGVRLANWEYGGGPIVLDAFDPEYFRNPSYGEWPLHGDRLPDAWERVAEGKAVVVSSSFAQNLRVAVGESITLATPNGPLPLLVAGITTDFASPRGTIEMSREVYKRYWNDPKVTRFFVEFTQGSDLVTGRARLEDALRGREHSWRVISSGELVAYFGTQIRRAFASLYVLAAVILAVVLFGIADNLSASIAERMRELGTLRAFGVRRRRLRRIVVVEALVIASLGLCLAIATGVAIAGLWAQSTIPYLLGWVIDLSVPVEFIVLLSVLTLASCSLAAALPARRAGRLEPAVALRSE